MAAVHFHPASEERGISHSFC